MSEFVYDYASRLAWSREYDFADGGWTNPKIKRRVFDGMDVIQERSSNNYMVAQLVRDGNIGGILSRLTVDGPAFYGYDGNGNVTLLTNSAGQDVGHYRYDAFGNTLEATGPRAGENPYRFSTKELHGPSGLYDYGLRFYSPGMARWLNRDPLEEDGGVNLYGFVGNNPINDVDEYGMVKYLGGPVVWSNGSEAMGGAGGKLSPGVPPIPTPNMGSGGAPLPLSDFDKMMAKRMEGVNPWMDGSAAPIGSPMYGMGAAVVPKGIGPYRATYGQASKTHVYQHGHAANAPRQAGKSRFRVTEGGRKFAKEVINHPNTVKTIQRNGRVRYDNYDLGRVTGRNINGNPVRGGRVVIESRPSPHWSPFGPREVVTQFPQ